MNRSLLWKIAPVLAVAIVGCRSVPASGCANKRPAPKPPSDQLARIPTPPYVLGKTGTGSLIGYLADSATGMGIPQGSVVVQPDSGNYPARYAVTDTAGGFLLRDLTPGVHSFYAGRIAYLRVPFQARIEAGQVDTVRLRTQMVEAYLPLCVITS